MDVLRSNRLDNGVKDADPGATPEGVPVRHENAWLNAGYAVQCWIFAGLVLVGFGWLARREAHPRQPDPDGPGPGPRIAGTRDSGR